MALSPHEQNRDHVFNHHTPDPIKQMVMAMVGASLSVLKASGYELPEGDALIVFRNATVDYFYAAALPTLERIHAEQRKKMN